MQVPDWNGTGKKYGVLKMNTDTTTNHMNCGHGTPLAGWGEEKTRSGFQADSKPKQSHKRSYDLLLEDYRRLKKNYRELAKKYRVLFQSQKLLNNQIDRRLEALKNGRKEN
jgi:hypothetical protein